MAVPVACILETPRESGTVLTPLKNQPALIVDMLVGAAASARGGRLVGEAGAGLAWRRSSGKERRQPGLGDRGGADVTRGLDVWMQNLWPQHALTLPAGTKSHSDEAWRIFPECIIKNRSRSRAKLGNFYSLSFLSSFMSESETEDLWAMVRRPCQLAALAQRWESGLSQRGAARPQSETWSQGERVAAEAKRRDKRTE